MAHNTRPRELDQLSLKKGWPRGHLSAVNKYLNGGYRGDGARLFWKVYSDRVRGSGHKL